MGVCVLEPQILAKYGQKLMNVYMLLMYFEGDRQELNLVSYHEDRDKISFFFLFLLGAKFDLS